MLLLKTMTKVLIVGAGPAGLSAAISILGESQHDVEVMDSKCKVGTPARCAGGISSFMLEKLEAEASNRFNYFLLLALFGPGSIATTINRVRMYGPSMKYWELRSVPNYGYVLDREVFEGYLAESVERLGGKIIVNTNVKTGFLDSAKAKYDYIVGADGPTSTVRSWLGLPEAKREDMHLGVQKTFVMDYFPSETIELYFGEKAAPKGYAWAFSCGGNKVRMGLGVPLSEISNDKTAAAKLLEDFIGRHVTEYSNAVEIAKLIPTGPMPSTGVYGKVLLAGDALPSTDPATGGGIIQALASGLAAGKAIAEGKPENYDKHMDWLRKQNRTRLRLKKVLFSFTDEDLDLMIETLQKFKPKSASVTKELRRAVIYVIARKPWMLKKLFKAL